MEKKEGNDISGKKKSNGKLAEVLRYIWTIGRK